MLFNEIFNGTVLEPSDASGGLNAVFIYGKAGYLLLMLFSH